MQLACLTFVLALVPGTALAETWFCAVNQSGSVKMEEYRIVGTELVHMNDQTSEGLPVEAKLKNHPKFHILQNTTDGIVAIQSDASHDKASAFVYADAILINKANGDFREFKKQIGNGPGREIHGRCAVSKWDGI